MRTVAHAGNPPVAGLGVSVVVGTVVSDAVEASVPVDASAAVDASFAVVGSAAVDATFVVDASAAVVATVGSGVTGKQKALS